MSLTPGPGDKPDPYLISTIDSLPLPAWPRVTRETTKGEGEGSGGKGKSLFPLTGHSAHPVNLRMPGARSGGGLSGKLVPGSAPSGAPGWRDGWSKRSGFCSGAGLGEFQVIGCAKGWRVWESVSCVCLFSAPWLCKSQGTLREAGLITIT